MAPGEEDHGAIELAFSKKKIEERKQWLASFVPGTFLDQSVEQISYSDFVNKARACHFLKNVAQGSVQLATEVPLGCIS